MTRQSEMITFLFEGLPHRHAASLLSNDLESWMLASARFTEFVETYRDKIRKKIRVTRDRSGLMDVRSELEVAYRLLNDRRFTVAYELFASAKIRGPDFTITYRDNLKFNIEVAHMRAEEGVSPETAPSLPALDAVRARKEERILRILLDKLGQMQPGMPNLLVIHTESAVAQWIDLDRLMQAIKTRVEGKDPVFYALSRYPTPAAFYKDFLRLSGILLWAAGSPKQWANKQARPALDEKILRLVGQLPG